ncbi:MAG TPA: endonuclease [Porphyromonadaceae bacterium]|jgi:RHS repeat-associated protein|nr:endonuclease [Porphyromonadaceae bacterium]
MKIFYTIIIFLLSFPVIYSQQDAFALNIHKNFPELDSLTDEQIQQRKDSILSALYPPLRIDSATPPPGAVTKPVLRSATSSTRSAGDYTNNYVKDSYLIDKSKDVGEIPMSSSVSPGGSVACSVPIEVAQGRQGFQPQLTVSYNSQGGNGVLGVGWNIGGWSRITRVGKSMYYDSKASGVNLANDDAFVLDGMRLIKLSATSSQIDYQTEQGNIKVKAVLSGSAIRYFEVNYPNGNKGIFGQTGNYGNQLTYPLYSLTDLKGNTITYNFSMVNYRAVVNSISYIGGSVLFTYGSSRSDPIITYEAGRKITENYRLEKIECKSGSTTFRIYDFTYRMQNYYSVLSQIGCTASGKSLNPLQFLYGEGNTSSAFAKDTTKLREWYTGVTDPGQLIVSKGKFDYGTEDDGIISLPNKLPYWQHYKHSTWFTHSQRRFDNQYTGSEKIFLYAGLSTDWADPLPNLTTEGGFIEIFCANTDGKYEEELIKVNNYVSGNYDHLIFKVYGVNLYTGLHLKYTRTYDFSTLLVDESKNKSIHPKSYYSGDFNGDGKMEVLAVSCHQPFDYTNLPTVCYLFDLESGIKRYEGQPFQFYKEFLGIIQTDGAAAVRNSDKLFAYDYDCDGKTDICLIKDNGVYFYTFDISGSSYSVRQVAFSSTLRKSDLYDRELLMGEFNGDGKVDFLLSPKVGYSDWFIYYSKGNGQFEKSAQLSITSRIASDRFFTQDVNNDGLTDVIGAYGTTLATHHAKPGGFSYVGSTSLPSSTASVVPTNINSRNYFHQIVALKDGKATRYSFQRNDTREKLLTGAVNSVGVVQKNYYRMLNENDQGYGFYSEGYGAVYPYENFHGPLFVAVASEQYVNGQKTEDNTYRYENAVIHKQGRGFCGFGKIHAYDNVRGRTTTQEFDPYNFGIAKSDESLTAKNTYTYSVSVQSNKIAKVNMTNRSSLSKLTDKTVTSTHVYDTYGNPTKETINYGDGVTAVSDQTYYNSATGSLYLLGQPVSKTVTNIRGGASWVDKETVSYNTARLPISKITYTGTGGTQKTGETKWEYDTNNNVISEKSAPYNVTEFLGTTYAYDANGIHLASGTNALGQTTAYADYDAYGNPRKITDHKNHVTTRNYDEWGQLTSVVHPDGVTETTTSAWGGSGLYTVTATATGQPTTVVHYDALGREIRTGSQRFDGQWQYVDKVYDSYGRVEKTSLPFKGSSASYWNTYSYDYYDRPTQLSEASGKTTSWEYNGLSTTETKNGIATTKTTDASGALVSVTDPGGTITYALRPDGQPSSVTAPGGVVTSFGYDAFGRQTSIADPSAGTQTFSDSYTAAGVLTRKVTDANGKTVTSTYDKYGRITDVARPEFSTTYAYNTDGLLTAETSTNGTSNTFSYDTYDRPLTERESVPEGKYLQKDYTYSGGNVATVTYTSQSGAIGTEQFTYAYGHNTEIKFGTTSVWKLTEENALGQPTKATTGPMNRTYSYTTYGMPTGRTAGTVQSFTYDFDVAKGNLKSRTDITRSLTETFGYDNLNRLTDAAGKAITYAANGNITSMGGVGTMDYGNTAKPYQVTMLTPTGDAVPEREQTVSYTSFQRPNSITENGVTAAFLYNAAGERVKMQVFRVNSPEEIRYYIGGQYEVDDFSHIERLYLGGDAYSAPAVYVKENTTDWRIYYICRDYLGSITHIANADGSLKQELSYDAWGRLRNPATQVAYAPDSEPALFLGRGYTGHEHLIWFGLVNMNARLYDAALGRFLAPDPYVQMVDFSQNFNRYSYCLNNPLVYVDENGEFWHIIIGAIVGGVTNLITNWDNVDGFWDGLTTFTIGAGAGAATAATGGAGAGFWAVAGVSAAGGAMTSASNDIVAQTGKNFSGIENVNWGSVGKSTLVGTAASFAGGAAGYWAAGSSVLVNNINSPIARSAIVSPLSSGAGHIAGGTTAGLLSGQDLGTAFNNSFNGLGTSMAVGGAIGVASTIGVSYANGINPLTGKSLNNSNNYPGNNPSKAPKGYEWRGKPNSTPGMEDGNWYNPKTGETLRPDLNHPTPIGPHWDYRDTSGQWWRVFPDGSKSPK